MNITRKELEEVLKKVGQWWEHGFTDTVTRVITELLKEKLATLPDEWHRRTKQRSYLRVLGHGKIDMSFDIDSPTDNWFYESFNYFPVLDFKKEQLESDGVSRFGLLERIAYRYGHAHGDWLTEEERLNPSKRGYCVRYYIDDGKWNDIWAECSYCDKWFAKIETAEGLAEWLNENCDHNGVMK